MSLFKQLVIGHLLFSATFSLSTENHLKDEDLIVSALEMQRYEKDTAASVVIISDIGWSHFNFEHAQYGIELIFERRIIVKIIDSDGYGWADFAIPLYRGSDHEEEAMEIKGYTYKLERGKLEKTKLRRESIFREETNRNWKKIKITMPDIHEGSVYELSYKVSSPFIFNLQSWTFQFEVPVIYSEYQVDVPEYLHYNKNLRGYHPISEHHTDAKDGAINSRAILGRPNYQRGGTVSNREAFRYTEYIERWIAKDVPAFIQEPYLTNADNFKTALTFELGSTKFPNELPETYTSTWEAITEILRGHEDFGQAIERSAFLKKIMASVLDGSGTPRETILKIHEYVKDKMKWNDRSSIFTSGSLKSTHNDGIGNCADINLLLIAMLREAGQEAYPVVLSTRSNGMVYPTTPTITSFNYVIAAYKLGDQLILVDATEPLADLGVLPMRCLNGDGRLITESGGKWIPVTSKSSKTKTMVSYSFDDDLVVGTHKSMHVDQAAYDFYKSYTVADGEEVFSKVVQDQHPGLIINSVRFENMDKQEASPMAICEVELEDFCTKVGDLLYFNPMFTDAIESNPFKLEERAYPVDYGVQHDHFYYAKIQIPERYVVETQPEDLNILMPNKAAQYIYAMTVVGNIISLRSHLKINQTLYTSDTYPDLKNFYDLVVKRQAEQVVLKKQ